MLTALIDRLTGFLRPDHVRDTTKMIRHDHSGDATKMAPSERDRAPLVSPITLGLLEAIGIRHALDVHGLERVALIDFDVHHGNGSADILDGDDRV